MPATVDGYLSVFEKVCNERLKAFDKKVVKYNRKSDLHFSATMRSMIWEDREVEFLVRDEGMLQVLFGLRVLGTELILSGHLYFLPTGVFFGWDDPYVYLPFSKHPEYYCRG